MFLKQMQSVIFVSMTSGSIWFNYKARLASMFPTRILGSSYILLYINEKLKAVFHQTICSAKQIFLDFVSIAFADDVISFKIMSYFS